MGGTSNGPRASPGLPGEEGVAARRRDALLIALTFASGAVDAVSYLGLGQIFTANMTGNVVFLALAVGARSLPSALHSGLALIVFSLGALGAGQVLGRRKPAGSWPTRVTWLLWIELAVMVAVAIGWSLSGGVPGPTALYLLIGASSFGMGIQNASARHLAVPGLTTTVVTGALTGFMVDLPALGISGPSQRRAGWSVVALFAGAAAGGTLMFVGRVWAPWVTVATVGMVAVLARAYFGEASNPST